jgi:hypothetical protein
MNRGRGSSARLWLPALVTAMVSWTMYHVAADAERGSRAGAEPVMAGVMIALPFFALFLFEVLCAIYAMVSESRTAPTRSLWSASVAAALVAGLVVTVSVIETTEGYLSPGSAVRVACIVAALLLPLVPGWGAQSREPSRRVGHSATASRN